MPSGMIKGFIIDVDGTIADNSDRGPFDWNSVENDLPIELVISNVRALTSLWTPIFVSGRSDACKNQTANWISKNVFPPPFELFMRRDGDYRKDEVVKKEIYDRHIRSFYAIQLILDDRNSVVSMWRELGLPTYQVAFGDF